eukprot:1981050-Prymnesium_polylepis.2
MEASRARRRHRTHRQALRKRGPRVGVRRPRPQTRPSGSRTSRRGGPSSPPSSSSSSSSRSAASLCRSASRSSSRPTRCERAAGEMARVCAAQRGSPHPSGVAARARACAWRLPLPPLPRWRACSR